MMRTTPWRRTTLQLRQIFFTDAPTFISILLIGAVLTPVIPEISFLQQIPILLLHHMAL